MKLIKVLTGLVSSLFLSTYAIAGYIPVGVQTDVQATTFDTWGWTACYQKVENTADYTTISQISSRCNGDYTLMGLYDIANQTYAILAAGESNVVFNQTPGVYASYLVDGFNISNGVNWYLYDNPTSVYGGWGFFSPGSTVYPVHCDYQDYGNVNKYSICLHMRDIDGAGDGDSSDDYYNDVYSYFNAGQMNFAGNNFEIRLFTQDISSNDIPEPFSIALVLFGLLGLHFTKKSK